MKKIIYPPKPWTDKDRHYLIPDVEFIYNASLKRWIPLTLQSSYDNSDYAEMSNFEEVVSNFKNLETLVLNKGTLWKLSYTPDKTNNNDLYYNIVNSKLYSYYVAQDTWVQIV